MAKEEVELDFEFSNDELANFLKNFSEKIRDGKVGLSFKGREEVEIEPTHDSKLELDFYETEQSKQLKLEIKMKQELETTDTGRPKLKVKVV
jgi:amphi-Trp domain-containing protein